MEFIYYISEKHFDGNEKQIQIAEVLRLIPHNSLQKLQDGQSFFTEKGVIWAEEK